MYLIVAGIQVMAISQDNTMQCQKEKDIELYAKTLAAKYPECDINIFKLQKKWLPQVDIKFKKYIITDLNEILPE